MTTQPWLHGSTKASIAVLMLAVTIAYIERSAISHALPFIIDEIKITKEQSGWILSSFGIGYIVSLPMSGWILRKVGHARTLRWISIGWLCSAIGFSLAGDYKWMIVARLSLGLFEGPLFPLFVSWISLTNRPESRPLKIGAVEACSYVGMAISGPITVLLAQSTTWRASYAVVGGMAALAWIASFFLAEIRHSPNQESTDLPQHGEKRIFMFFSVGLVAVGFLLYNTAKTFYSTWFPTLLVKEFGFTSMEASQVTFFQSLVAPAASLILTAIAVFILGKGYSLLIARCLPLTIGLAFGAVIVMAHWYPQSIAAISMVAFVGLISTSALIWNAVPDNVDTVKVGTTAGYINAFSNIGSILSPIAVGYLLHSSRDHVLAFVSLACALAIPSFLLAYSTRRNSRIVK